LERLDAPITYFPTFEALDRAFRRRIAGLTPRTHAGARRFWEDFRRLWDTAAAQPPGVEEACITLNPRHSLAFGTPWQELQAAIMIAGPPPGATGLSPEQLAEAYGLRDQLHQPVRSLSGGEAVKLALARSHALAPGCRRLTIASPFSWLAAANRPLLVRLLGHYRCVGRALEIFALEGEDNPDPPPAPEGAPAPLEFGLRIRGGRVILGTPLEALRAPPACAAVEDTDTVLCSPCLLSGANGAGKSLTAKALAGAVGCHGEWRIGRGAAPSRARLLLQDVLAQTLMRPLARLARGSADGSASTGELFQRILYAYREALGAPAAAAVPDGVRPPTLVAIKAMLAAERLRRRPGALILDEPDWGLSRAAALSLVGAVGQVAHRLEVPLVIISHKTWWMRMAASRLEVAKGPPGRTAAFSITLAPAGGAP
jgi:energy-coupling factor transporter ATP-binding protein EcfA2